MNLLVMTLIKQEYLKGTLQLLLTRTVIHLHVHMHCVQLLV